MGLSLVVGIAIARLLDRLYQCQINLKWPNDLYAEHKKLGGILVELTGQTHAQCDVVIGVGLNIQMPADSNAKISQAFTDLASVSGQSIERNQLVSQLQFELIQTLQSFENKGFVAFADEFNRRDEFAGQRVQLSGGNAPTIGICQGVDQYGGLVVRQADGLKSFYSGELSLRKHGD
jgi:BirA family biotin operon repressor/biotin-[acetyl-CoA-carboxylase] ligase